jgi:hypothetical protein
MRRKPADDLVSGGLFGSHEAVGSYIWLIYFSVQIGTSALASASNRAVSGSSIERGVEPFPPLRSTWRSLAPDVRVFNNRR